MGPRVVVIGAGVSGLTTAVRLLQAGAQVLVRTAAAPIGTVSAVAGAMIGPVFGDPADPAVGWARASDIEFRRLAGQPGTGVTVRRGRLLSTPAFGDQLPPWASTIAGFRPLGPGELPAGFPTGMWAELPFADMPVYLTWLVGKVARLGGRIEQSPVTDLADVDGDVVANCLGLAASALAHDPELTPVRGQHVIVDAPWLTEFVYEGGAEDHWVGVMPHGRRVVLGGVAQPGDTSLAPDPVITEQILQRCIAVLPELAAALVLGVEVGIRPGRPRVRLERVDSGPRPVVHNYGHAGNGVMLSWGCADAVTALALG